MTLFHGTYAAVLTPRDQEGQIDESRLRTCLLFLMEAGIQGFALNGATGEFCVTTEKEFETLVGVAAEVTRRRATFLAGIGAAGHHAAIRLAKTAYKAGASGLLLPMPYFFPYSQADLAAFSRTVAASVELPVLLYNLPQFTSPLEPATSLALIEECETIVGIKDSSGSLDTLRLLTEHGVPSSRIVGNDGALAQALKEKVVDGVVSGVACALPELIQKIFSLGASGTIGEEFEALVHQLDQFRYKLDEFPVPWGLKVAAETRGLGAAAFSQPLSSEREQEIASFSAWLVKHLPELIR